MDKQEIQKIVLETIREYNKSKIFIDRKTADTPTDAYSLANRRFVTLNGTVASRPPSSIAVLGQHYFATNTSILMIYGGTGWVNSVGSIVAQNR